MGVFGNDQVGYTGTPQTIDQFKGVNGNTGGLTNFKNTNTVPNVGGWPQFYNDYANIMTNRPAPFAYLKFPSLLEIFQRLAGANPPTDLSPLITPQQWSLGPPASLSAWPPIQALFTNWTAYAGMVTASSSPPYYTTTSGSCPGTYQPGTPITTWCNALIAQKALLLTNYTKYRQLFLNGTCNGTPVDINNGLLVAHLYGFTPWVEASPGTGCNPLANLLQDTPGYYMDKTVNNEPFRDYTNYHIVKTAYDKLNYNILPSPGYVLNPYSDLIHNPAPALNIPCAYAYSVDDAQGNVQAEGQGFIVDVGSTVNLENSEKCNAPVSITLGYNNPPFTPRFLKYAVCQNIPTRIKPVIPGFASFVISATNPAACPIYLWDNKGPDTVPPGPQGGQMYTFTLNADPNNVAASFPFFQIPANATWVTANHANVGCKGNYPASGGTIPPYEPSSQFWCCDQASSSGIYAFSQSAETAHASLSYNINTLPAKACLDGQSCHVIVTPCNGNQ
jgi:hypothetical protein